MTAQDILEKEKYLRNQDANWTDYYQDLASFCLPRKAWINTVRYKGERLQLNFLFDSTAIRGLKIAASGFHSNLSNPAQKWFGLETRNPKLMDSIEVRMWFKEVEDVLYSILNNSNLDTTLQEFYTDALCFGTGTILTMEDPEDTVRFTLIPVEQTSFEEDDKGRVCAVYRKFKYTAKQAFKMWGAEAGKNILEALENKPYDQFEFLHYVGPRHERDVAKTDGKNMPWMSVWINVAMKEKIAEGGFFEFPYHVGRFYKDPTDVRGYSPAMDVLADIKLINAQKKTTLRRAMKEADPPMTMPSRGFLAPLNLNPAAINYRDEKTSADSIQAIGVGAGQFTITQEVVNDTKDNIEQGFFVPYFRALSDVTKEMTVPEVQHRILEAMALLGPAVGRMTKEVHSSLIARVFNIAWRGKQLPPPPPQIQNAEWQVVYLGQLAKAQRSSEVANIQGFMQEVGMIAQMDPAALDNVNSDKIVNVLAKIRAVTPEFLRGEKEKKDIRDARAKQQAINQKMAMARVASETTKNMASARGDHAKAEAM